MRLLREAFAANAIRISSEITTRTAAIEACGELLVESGRVRQEYVLEMLQAIEEFGPYIVIAPGIALAHGKPSENVITTGLSLLSLLQPVAFDHPENDPVSLVIGLAATDHQSHLGLMAELAQALSTKSIVNSLLTASEEAAIRELLA